MTIPGPDATVVNGVIESATGDLVRAGYSEFEAGDGEELRDDVPIPFFVRGGVIGAQYWRWTGTEWVLVDQPSE